MTWLVSDCTPCDGCLLLVRDVYNHPEPFLASSSVVHGIAVVGEGSWEAQPPSLTLWTFHLHSTAEPRQACLQVDPHAAPACSETPATLSAQVAAHLVGPEEQPTFPPGSGFLLWRLEGPGWDQAFVFEHSSGSPSGSSPMKTNDSPSVYSSSQAFYSTPWINKEDNFFRLDQTQSQSILTKHSYDTTQLMRNMNMHQILGKLFIIC